MDLREIGWEEVDWIRLAQDRDQWRAVVSAVMNLRVSCATELVKSSLYHSNHHKMIKLFILLCAMKYSLSHLVF
jgi:hypothetical protein